MSAVAHSGCRPSCFNSRKGHHEMPHTKALSSNASAGARPARSLTGMRVVVGRDALEVLVLRGVLLAVAAMPPVDDVLVAGLFEGDCGDRAERGEAQARG